MGGVAPRRLAEGGTTGAVPARRGQRSRSWPVRGPGESPRGAYPPLEGIHYFGQPVSARMGVPPLSPPPVVHRVPPSREQVHPRGAHGQSLAICVALPSLPMWSCGAVAPPRFSPLPASEAVAHGTAGRSGLKGSIAAWVASRRVVPVRPAARDPCGPPHVAQPTPGTAQGIRYLRQTIPGASEGTGSLRGALISCPSARVEAARPPFYPWLCNQVPSPERASGLGRSPPNTPRN